MAKKVDKPAKGAKKSRGERDILSATAQTQGDVSEHPDPKGKMKTGKDDLSESSSPPTDKTVDKAAPAKDAKVPALEADQPQQKPGGNQEPETNLYASKKRAAHGMLDLALLMANASKLKQVLVIGSNHRFYWPLLVLLSISIILQLFVGVCVMIHAQLRRTNEKQISETIRTELKSQVEESPKAPLISDVIIAALFLLTMLNIVIGSLGMTETPDPFAWECNATTGSNGSSCTTGPASLIL